MSSLFDSIANVISHRFNIDRKEIVPEASFDDLGLDSLSQIELATALEKQLGIAISDDDISEMSAVSEIVDALGRKKATM